MLAFDAQKCKVIVTIALGLGSRNGLLITMLAVSVAALVFAAPGHAPHSLAEAVLGGDVPTSFDMTLLSQEAGQTVQPHAKEKRLRNIRQLTFGGQNAEAYFSADGKKIIYQTRQPEWPDEQIIMMNLDGSDKKLISTGKGRCTCSYFTPNQEWVYFSSTHEKNEGAQLPVDMSKGYVWMVNPQFSLYRRNVKTNALEPVLQRDGYVAETTIDPNGRYMTFTGAFEGDLDIYRADLDGKNIRKLTTEFGYDGGPFVSWDGKWIVYRRSTLADDAARKEYSDLLKQNLVRPSRLEVWIMDASGNQKRQVTTLGAASFAPFLHPNNRQIIFSSNFGDRKGREFELWMIDRDGKNLERVTYTSDFDGFPMWSRDGKKIVWASNRNGKVRGETNIFIADWVDNP
jgi:TolB protein